MRRVIMTGGNNIRSRLVIGAFVVIGVLLLILFAAIAFSLAVVLIPVGILLYIIRRLFFSDRNRANEPESEQANQSEIKDIIDITDYEETEDLKALSGGNKDGK
ncbi:MAG: hypothetical protein A2044_07780 [Candidatus Firestonebacteria bacterium GWA2_43_8]|nr:MAG: hypothetical protein A2044_07780 [Candidatus Firestonebacteria bacterium GWA2_43_8]